MATADPTSYVEVIGEASYEEPIEFFNAEVTLAVRATSDDNATTQLAAFRTRCVDALVHAGLRRDEIRDGGMSLDRPWWWRRKEREAGKNAGHRLLIKSADLERVSAGLNAIESTPANSRETVEVNMRPPVFVDDHRARNAALGRAVDNARERAAALVAAAGDVTLGQVLRIEEGTSAHRASNFAGDEDWWGDRMRFAAGGAGGGAVMASVGEAPEPLATPNRTIWVRCRVRVQLLGR